VPTAQVLDIGQCHLDRGSIRRMIERAFDAQVTDAESGEQAMSLVSENRYDLVLINRLLDRDRSSGIELLRKLKNENQGSDIPMMLVSDKPDAQAEAEANGAAPGFGKAALSDQTTIEHLAQYLPRLGEKP
jgi:CheY-like chemotaxis protein